MRLPARFAPVLAIPCAGRGARGAGSAPATPALLRPKPELRNAAGPAFALVEGQRMLVRIAKLDGPAARRLRDLSQELHSLLNQALGDAIDAAFVEGEHDGRGSAARRLALEEAELRAVR